MSRKRPKKILKPEQAAKNVTKAHERLEGKFITEILPGGDGVHVGYTIKRLMKKLDLTTPTLASLLGISQQNTSAMYRKKYLHTTALVKVSHALQHDVVRYLYKKEFQDELSAKKQHLKDLEAENAILREKVAMLEKMVNLLERK